MNDSGIMIHTIRLQYWGGIKEVEKKVQKSEQLLDAEFFHIQNINKLKKADEALENNRNKMTADGFEKLANYLPKAKQQLQRREKQLK